MQTDYGGELVKEWQEISGICTGDAEIAGFVSEYFRDTRTEEEFGLAYLRILSIKHPDYSDRIHLLMRRHGAGAYITHWFLEKAGVVCR